MTFGWEADEPVSIAMLDAYVAARDNLEAIVKARGVSMAEVALAWLVARPAVTSMILGARTPEQLRQNLKADALSLSGEA